MACARPLQLRRPSCCSPRQGVLRVAFFDVDGVLTDGRIYIGEHGEIAQGASTRSTATA